MSPRFVLGRENVPCVAEVVNKSLKADCTDFMHYFHPMIEHGLPPSLNLNHNAYSIFPRIQVRRKSMARGT